MRTPTTIAFVLVVGFASAGAGQADRPGRPVPPPPDQQTQSDGTAAIRGRVTRGDTGQPLRRVQVRAEPQQQDEVRTALTDDKGRYELTRLPSGRYKVVAERGGFVTIEYGQRRPFSPGRPLTLEGGETLEKIDFAMPRGAVITGRVADDVGEPVTRAQVQLWRYAYQNGQRRLTSMYGDATDDRGEFRIFDLSPGEYHLSASMNVGPGVSETGRGYTRTYYPGTPIPAEAQRISVGVGEEVTGIAFALVAARMMSLSGTVRGTDGRPMPVAMVIARAAADDQSAGLTSIQVAATRPDGSFTIGNLSPGTYIVEAQSLLNPGAEVATAEAVVSGSDVTGVSLEMTRARSARGRILFDTGQPPPQLRPREVRVMATSPSPDSFAFSGMADTGRVADDWTFEVTGLFGPQLLRAMVLGSWTVKNIVIDGTDVTDTALDFREDVDGIEVTLTQRTTELSGRVTDERGRTAADAFVVVFAQEREKWGPMTRFIQTARPDQEGRFTITGLPPGDYVAAAVEYLEPGEEMNPELLEQLRPRGTTLSLREGETRTLGLQIAE